MSWPPYALSVKHTNRHKRFRLWLPLFLFWPLLLMIFFTALVINVIRDLFATHGFKRVKQTFAAAALFWALKGLVVNHQAQGKQSYVVFK